MKHDCQQDSMTPERSKPRYEPPRIVAYDESELLEMIGPAVACARWGGSSRDGDDPDASSYESDDYDDF